MEFDKVIIDGEEVLLDDAFIEKYEGLVRFVIKKNFSSYYNYNEDLLQSGRVGLLLGAKNYDDSKGVKFSTFIYFYIYKHVFDCISYEIDFFCKPAYIRNSKEKRKKYQYRVIYFGEMEEWLIEYICNQYNFTEEDNFDKVSFRLLFDEVKKVVTEEELNFLWRREVDEETLEDIDRRVSKEANRTRLIRIKNKIKKTICNYKDFLL